MTNSLIMDIKNIKGMDISTLTEVETCGGKFFDHGNQEDPLDILKKYGTNSVRLRLWNDPKSIDGKPYGAGNNDLKTVIELAKRAKKKGMSILLDLHYSDFWADPGKQVLPKAWADLGIPEIKEQVELFTTYVLNEMGEHQVFPDMIQTGNELSNGLLWPYGKVPQYDNIADFINAAIKGVKSVSKDLPIMLHLDNGGNNELYRTWFDEYFKRGDEFEYIGLSYYPFWHGSMNQLEFNMKDISERYGKELIVSEVSMGFTMDDYKSYEKLTDSERKGMATKKELVEKLEFPMTPQGQSDFMYKFLKIIDSIPEKKGKGFYYWEPCWIPVPGSEWATEEGRAYVKDPGAGGNEWANQALFDYNGNALPALKTIRDFRFHESTGS